MRCRITSAGVVLAVFTTVIGLSAPAAPPAGAIVGGERVTTSAPWAVALVNSGSGTAESRAFCSGVLVGRRWVLTARHCVRHDRYSASRTKIVVGRIDLRSSRGVVARVAYTRSSPDTDAALIRLDRDVNVTPARLAGTGHRRYWEDGDAVRAYGYGKTSPSSGMSRYLRRAPTTFRFSSNPAFYKSIYSGRNSICQGDSGGPLFVTTPDGPRLVALATGTLSDGKDGATPCRADAYQWSVRVGAGGSGPSGRTYRWIRSYIG